MEEDLKPTHELKVGSVTVKSGSFDEVWEYLEERSRLYNIGILHLITFMNFELNDLRDNSPYLKMMKSW